MKRKNNHLFFEILIPVLVVFSAVFIFFGGRNFVFNSKIKIGLLSDFKTSARDGARLAILEINNKGGIVIKGRRYQVEIIQKDNQGKPDNNDILILDLIKENISGVISVGEDISLKSKDMLNEKGILFSVFSNEDKYNEGNFAADFAFSYLKTKKAAILFNKDNPIFEKQAENFKNTFESLGGTVTFFESITDKTAELVTIILRLKGSSADMVFFPLRAKDVPYYVQLSHYFSFRVPFLGTEGWADEKLVSVCGMECFGSYFLSYFYPNTERNRFTANYKDYYKNGPTEEAYSGYELTNSILLKIQNGDKTIGKVPYDVVKIEEEKTKIIKVAE